MKTKCYSHVSYICYQMIIAIQEMLCMCMLKMYIVMNGTRHALISLDSKLYSSVAQDFSKDRSINLANITFPSNPHDTGNLLSVLNVKVGARVMLTTNIDVCDGLTNRVMGTVSGVIEKRGKVHVILVKFDSDGVGTSAKAKSVHKGLFPGTVPIGRIEATFSVKNRVMYGFLAHNFLFFSVGL